MPRSSNQKIKILYLMKILLEYTDNNNGLTLEEISDILREHGVEAERKTLYDDLEVLRNFGIDIEKRKDKTVRYYVVSREFELPELKLLVDAVQSSKFITRKKSAELIKKIEGFTSRYEANQLQRQVFVSNRIKTMNESIYYTVDYIHEAINNNVKIAFQYFDWNEKKEKILRHNGKKYLISPWGLTWDDENYYMIGYDSQNESIRHYRVDKMTKISLTDEKRDGTKVFKNFDMAIYSNRTFGMYGGKEETVSLRCKNRLSGIILDRFGHDISFISDIQGCFKINIKVHISPIFLTWLMNFGDDITILSPQSVKEEFIALAKKSLSQYE